MAIKHGQLRIDANSKLSNSHTLDSLNELQVSKTGTPSMISRYMIIYQYEILGNFYIALCFEIIYHFNDKHILVDMDLKPFRQIHCPAKIQCL